MLLSGSFFGCDFLEYCFSRDLLASNCVFYFSRIRHDVNLEIVSDCVLYDVTVN